MATKFRRSMLQISLRSSKGRRSSGAVNVRSLEVMAAEIYSGRLAGAEMREMARRYQAEVPIFEKYFFNVHDAC